jgi:drug/metabolite transporter (DMT)-like permease
MTAFLEHRSLRFWIGAAFLASAAAVLVVATGFGSVVGLKGVALASFLAALSARFLSYELQDPGFSRTRSLLVATILVAIVAMSFALPDRKVVPIYFIAAALVAGGTAGDLFGLWKKRRLAD